MSNQRQIDWFIHALDSHTSEVIGRQIDQGELFPEMMCLDGKRRNLFRCSWENINFLEKSRGSSSLNFRIFSREKAVKSDTGGKPKDVTFLFRGRKDIRIRTTQNRRSR